MSQLEEAGDQRWKINHISPSKLSTWSDCQLKFWFRYVQGIKTPGKVWLPQGTAVHGGVEHLLDDLLIGKEKDLEWYKLKVEEAWEQQVDRDKGVVISKQGFEMSHTEKYQALQEAQHWFAGFYNAIADGKSIAGFDPRTVTKTEVDAIRKVDFGTDEVMDVHVRGKIDWVVDTNGPIAKLADLKTCHPRYGWTDLKAHAQLQATAYGYLTHKPTDFDYIAIPKEDIFTAGGKPKTVPKPVIPHRATTHRSTFHYEMFERRLRQFVELSDLENEYAAFKPVPNHVPGNWGGQWCGHMCDYQEHCRNLHGV